VNSNFGQTGVKTMAVNPIQKFWIDNEQYRFRLTQHESEYYQVSTVKKTIKGTIYFNDNRININDLGLLVNYNTQYKNTNFSTLSAGERVRVKGYLVDSKTILASSIEKVDLNDQQFNHDMRIIAALLLLKYKN
jgi:hypothetical protein